MLSSYTKLFFLSLLSVLCKQKVGKKTLLVENSHSSMCVYTSTKVQGMQNHTTILSFFYFVRMLVNDDEYLNLIHIYVNKSLYLKYSFVCGFLCCFWISAGFFFLPRNRQYLFKVVHVENFIWMCAFKGFSYSFNHQVDFNEIVVMKMPNMKCTCSCQFNKLNVISQWLEIHFFSSKGISKNWLTLFKWQAC